MKGQNTLENYFENPKFEWNDALSGIVLSGIKARKARGESVELVAKKLDVATDEIVSLESLRWSEVLLETLPRYLKVLEVEIPGDLIPNN